MGSSTIRAAESNPTRGIAPNDMRRRHEEKPLVNRHEKAAADLKPLAAGLLGGRDMEEDNGVDNLVDCQLIGLNLQGVKLGRPSWIHIAIDVAAGNISRVRVGGTSVFVAEGAMEVED